jgi:DNA-binding CsgD family transcriptional regulator
MLSDDNYDLIVEAIYEAAVDPLRWAGVVDRLTVAFDAVGASVFTPFAARLGFEPVWSTNADPEFVQAYATRYAQRDILADALWRRVPMENMVYRWEELIDRQVIESWDGYQDLLSPRGVYTGIGAIAEGGDHRVGQAMIYLPPWPEDRMEAAKRSLMRLTRHMRRAMSIHWHLANARQTTATAQMTIDMFKAGVMWLSGAGEVLYRNSEMDRILDLRDGIGIRAGKVRISDSADERAFSESIVKAAADESTVLPISRESGTASFCAKVMPLPLNASALRLPNACAIAFVSEPGRSSAAAAGEVARLYQLTPAETRVLERLARGGNSETISNELGSALSTIRTQIKAVMGKCGVGRQADLIRLVAELPQVGP